MALSFVGARFVSIKKTSTIHFLKKLCNFVMSAAAAEAASKQPLQHIQTSSRSIASFSPTYFLKQNSNQNPSQIIRKIMANSFPAGRSNPARTSVLTGAGNDDMPLNGHGSLKFNILGSMQSAEAAEAADEGERQVDNGFTRPDMYKASLVGTVAFYERHVFLCYKEAQSWPPQVEAAEFDRLPRHLVAALRARQNDMPKKTRLTICEGRDGTDSCNGDVFIFPDMLKYRDLTHFDVDTFVEEVLVRGKDWNPGRPEHLAGSHIFVCAHANRDARCGSCGPILIERFKEEIIKCGLKDNVFVRACSHIGGHKYAGNVIVYRSQPNGDVTGHWYGYVTPNDVTELLRLHVGKGQIVDRLWRGQMGLKEEEQKQAQQNRLLYGLSNSCQEEQTEGCVCGAKEDKRISEDSQKMLPKFNCINSLSQSESGNNTMPIRSQTPNAVEESKLSLAPASRTQSRWHMVTNFFETWEHDDTLVTLAVIGAAVSAGLAYRLYKTTI